MAQSVHLRLRFLVTTILGPDHPVTLGLAAFRKYMGELEMDLE